MNKKKGRKRIAALLLAFAMVMGVLSPGMSANVSHAADAVVNPNAVIDIVVNVPADYPGTFQDFKQELTAKLVAQGIPEGSFRIVSSAIKIDTTNQEGWYVYDHYYSDSYYDATDTTLQPYFADNAASSYLSHAQGILTVEKYMNVIKGVTNPQLYRIERHIASSVDAAGKASMTFVGYPKSGFCDFMIYPAASSSRRTISFDIDSSGVNTHSLIGAGFLLNAGIQNGKLQGYLLYYSFNSDNVSGTVTLYKLSGTHDASSIHHTSNYNITKGATKVVSQSFTMPSSTKKVRMYVDLKEHEVTLQSQDYNADGSFGDLKTLFTKAQTLESTGLNGFGPVVQHKSHSCKDSTFFEFKDLEMTYEADAFDALAGTQYLDSAEYKYFINLAGTNNSANIPDPEKDPEEYRDGVLRLAQNEIFYISNIDDGLVLGDPKGETPGVSSANGLYANTADDYTSLIADYIATNYKEQVKYDTSILDDLSADQPIANFIIYDKSNDRQVVSVHLKHMGSSSLSLGIKDLSKAGGRIRLPAGGCECMIRTTRLFMIQKTL